MCLFPIQFTSLHPPINYGKSLYLLFSWLIVKQFFSTIVFISKQYIAEFFAFETYINGIISPDTFTGNVGDIHPY